MSWQAYVEATMGQTDKSEDCVIAGYLNDPCVWASCPGGTLKYITSEEILAIITDNRGSLFINGLTLASQKCSVIRDCLDMEEDHTMDLRTKGEDQCNICVGKAKQALIILKGKKDAHGGHLNVAVSTMVKKLRDLDF